MSSATIIKRSAASSEDSSLADATPLKKTRHSEDNIWTKDVEAGLKKANERARALLAEGDGASTVEALTECLLLLGEHWPTQTRPNVAPSGAPTVRGACLGLVYGLGGQGMKVSKVSEAFPELTKFVNAAVRATLPDPSFTWSSLQLNYKYAARRHVDGNNLGPSYIIAVGEHTGGELWTEDMGLVDARSKWQKFNGLKLHETQPFEGTRVSIIAFTHNACDELTASTAADLKALGFTAGGSDRVRDAGDVVEEHFDAYWAQRLRDHPPPSHLGAVAVECAGWACGRGSAWVSFRAAKQQKFITSFFSSASRPKPSSSSSAAAAASTAAAALPPPMDSSLPKGVEKIDFQKNTTGFHVVELKLDMKSGGLILVQQKRFRLYDQTEQAAAEFSVYVKNLEPGRMVAISIADSAIAKSRPLPDSVYDALRLLGAPNPTEVIGYRNPFCGLFVKGAPPGSAAFALDKHAQSKTILRLTATVTAAATGSPTASQASTTVRVAKEAESSSSSSSSSTTTTTTTSSSCCAAGGVCLKDVNEERTLVTDILGHHKAIGKKGGKLVFNEQDLASIRADDGRVLVPSDSAAAPPPLAQGDAAAAVAKPLPSPKQPGPPYTPIDVSSHEE